MRHRGRFAPSPTGPLHFGSMVAAIASYCDARAHSGEWIVRMEDVDEPRTVPGAADDILRTLEAFGLHWDGDVVHQSQRKQLYREALDQLREGGHVYPCGCSRKDVTEIYQGTCRNGLQGRAARAWRVQVRNEPICWNDRVYGRQESNLEHDSGDFVLLRADGYFAYQLAVVVDDAEQGITDVVRGADLLDSTARQILLQRLLGYSSVRYLHVPVAMNSQGQKLSKQSLAPAVASNQAVEIIRSVMTFLGQAPPEGANAVELLREAIANWEPAAILSRAEQQT